MAIFVHFKTVWTAVRIYQIERILSAFLFKASQKLKLRDFVQELHNLLLLNFLCHLNGIDFLQHFGYLGSS
jgi:hypothetical protein